MKCSMFFFGLGIIGYFSILEFDFIKIHYYWFFFLLNCFDICTDTFCEVNRIHYITLFILLWVCGYFFLKFLLEYFTHLEFIWDGDYIYLGKHIKQYCCVFLLNFTLYFYIDFNDLQFFSSDIFTYYVFFKNLIQFLLYTFIFGYNVFWLPFMYLNIDRRFKYVEKQTLELVQFLKKTNRWVFIRKEKFFFILNLFRFIRVFFWFLLWFEHLTLFFKKIDFFNKYTNLCIWISWHFHLTHHSNNWFRVISLFILASMLSNVYFFQMLVCNVYFIFRASHWLNVSHQLEKPFSDFYNIFFKKFNHFWTYNEFSSYTTTPTLMYYRICWELMWFKKYFFLKTDGWLAYKYKYSYWIFFRPKSFYGVHNQIWFDNYIDIFINRRGTYFNTHFVNTKRCSYVSGLYWGFDDKNSLTFAKKYTYYFSGSDKKNFYWWGTSIDFYINPDSHICLYLSF